MLLPAVLPTMLVRRTAPLTVEPPPPKADVSSCCACEAAGPGRSRSCGLTAVCAGSLGPRLSVMMLASRPIPIIMTLAFGPTLIMLASPVARCSADCSDTVTRCFSAKRLSRASRGPHFAASAASAAARSASARAASLTLWSAMRAAAALRAAAVAASSKAIRSATSMVAAGGDPSSCIIGSRAAGINSRAGAACWKRLSSPWCSRSKCSSRPPRIAGCARGAAAAATGRGESNGLGGSPPRYITSAEAAASPLERRSWR